VPCAKGGINYGEFSLSLFLRISRSIPSFFHDIAGEKSVTSSREIHSISSLFLVFAKKHVLAREKNCIKAGETKRRGGQIIVP
jgi:hypothetical protein